MLPPRASKERASSLLAEFPGGVSDIGGGAGGSELPVRENLDPEQRGNGGQRVTQHATGMDRGRRLSGAYAGPVCSLGWGDPDGEETALFLEARQGAHHPGPAKCSHAH